MRSRPRSSLLGESLSKILCNHDKYVEVKGPKNLATLHRDQHASTRPRRYKTTRTHAIRTIGALTPRNLRSRRNPDHVQKIATATN